jgi:hypothetical protein
MRIGGPWAEYQRRIESQIAALTEELLSCQRREQATKKALLETESKVNNLQSLVNEIERENKVAKMAIGQLEVQRERELEMAAAKEEQLKEQLNSKKAGRLSKKWDCMPYIIMSSCSLEARG